MRLSEAIELLKAASVPDAEHDARVLYAEIGGISSASLFIGDPESDREELIKAIERRAKREPLQYILGKTYFYREEYIVNKSCLIPRQDTEILVDYAVKHIPSGELFLDLCTGSGCVGISTLKNTDRTRAVLADVSCDALDVARENVRLNGVDARAELRRADVLCDRIADSCFAVLSNPPYVKRSVYEGLEAEIGFEPTMAFVGGEDGLDFYERLTPLYRDVIAEGGFIAYEIGFDQADALRRIAESAEMTCEIIKDLSGNDRVAVLRRKRFSIEVT